MHRGLHPFFLRRRTGRPPDRGPRPWETVTRDELMHVRGALGTSFQPRIAPACPQDPVTRIYCSGQRGGHHGHQAPGLVAGAFFAPHLLNYPEAWWDGMLSEYFADGKTHFPLNISDRPDDGTIHTWGYSGVYPPAPSTPENVNKALKAIWKHGIPMCIGVGEHDTEGFEAAKRLADSIEPGLVRFIIPGLEFDQDFDNDTDRAARIHGIRAAFPSALLAIEPSPDLPASYWVEWFDQHGIRPDLYLLETAEYRDPAAALRIVAAALQAVGGRYPLVWFEYLAYEVFWQGMTPDAVRAYCDTVLDACYRKALPGGYRLAGFGDGGTPMTTAEYRAASSEPPPDVVPPPVDAIDLSRVVITRDADIRGWPVTSTVIGARRSGPHTICIDHTKRGAWPIVGFTGQSPAVSAIEGNQWIFVEIDGAWHGCAMEYMRPGQDCKDYSDTPWDAATEPIRSRWRPKAGDPFAVCVSTPARFHHARRSDERSNVVLMRW